MSSSKQVNKQVTSLFNMGSCENTRQGEGMRVRIGVRVEVREHVRLHVRVRGKVHNKGENDVGGNGGLTKLVRVKD